MAVSLVTLSSNLIKASGRPRRSSPFSMRDGNYFDFTSENGVLTYGDSVISYTLDLIDDSQ